MVRSAADADAPPSVVDKDNTLDESLVGSINMPPEEVEPTHVVGPMSCNDGTDGDDEAVATRHVAVRTTPLYLGAFHIFKSNVGVGIFLLPMVYNDFGYALSPIIAFPVGLVVIDCMLMLLSAKVKINKPDKQTYPDVAEEVFGSLARIVINGCIVMTQLSFCLMYLQAAGVILSQIFDFDGAYKVFVVVESLVVLPLCFLSNRLSLLAVTSMIATLLVWFTVISTMIFFLDRLRCLGVAQSVIDSPVGQYSKWPLFIASNLTVLEGIAVVLPVENAAPAADKPKVPRMVFITMLVIVCTYLVYAVTGYAAFGNALQNTSVTVIPKHAFGKFVRACLAVNLMFTHPVQFVPAIQVIDKALGIPADRVGVSKKSILTRVGINVLISMAALLIGGDALNLITAFVGSTAALVLAVIMPAFLTLHVDYATANPDAPRSGKEYYRPIWSLGKENKLRRLRCFVYIALGFAVFAFGTVTCVIDAASIVGHTSSSDSSTDIEPSNCTLNI